MKSELSAAVTHRADPSDYHALWGAIFGIMCPDAGHVEWLLDRIEGRAEARRWV